ncbi:MAG: PKD domain-containing protein [Acidimicrobiales bacterium]
MKRLFALAACIVVLVGAGPRLAVADVGSTGGCQGSGVLGAGEVATGIGCPGRGPKPGGPTGGGAGSYYWIVLGTWPLGCRNSQGQWTAYQEWQLVSPKGVYTGDPVRVCPKEVEPQGPPPPEQVWREVPLPTPVVNVNPSVAGITQLPSWFWVSGTGGTVSVTAYLDGWTVTASATAVSYEWHFGDGASTDSGSAGDEEHPSAVHTYQQMGTYYVALTVEYEGSYTVSGYGVRTSGSLGSYHAAEVTQAYTVQEVRSVLVPSGAVALSGAVRG